MTAPLDPTPQAPAPQPPPRTDYDPRPLLRRSKFVLTLIGQIGMLAALALCFIFMRDPERVRDILLYLAGLTTGGHLAQGFVDHARARAKP